MPANRTSSYVGYFATAFAQTLSAMLRRRRSQVVGAIVVMPAFIPLLLVFLPPSNDIETGEIWVFTPIIEIFYISAVAPLLALFFGTMLLGEDIESQTIPYILTRPTPRSAWVLGRFTAFLTACSGLMFVAFGLAFATSCVLQPLFLSVGNVVLLFHYLLAVMASLLGYGAICTFLGSVVRRPVVVGVLLIFGWQRGAMMAPGLPDFLTIEKHVNTLLPGGGGAAIQFMRESPFFEYKGELLVSAPAAALTLVAIAAVCMALTTLAVMRREYTTPTAVTE